MLQERRSAMSALGQKQAFAIQKGMSALPPKADTHFIETGFKETGEQEISIALRSNVSNDMLSGSGRRAVLTNKKIRRCVR